MNSITSKATIDSVALSQDGKFVVKIDVDDIYKKLFFKRTIPPASPSQDVASLTIYIDLPKDCTLFGIPIVWRTEGQDRTFRSR